MNIQCLTQFCTAPIIKSRLTSVITKFNPLKPSGQSTYPPVLTLVAFAFFLYGTFTVFVGISRHTANFALHNSQ
jgi:hypothetical protein